MIILDIMNDKHQQVFFRYMDKGLEKSALLDFRANTDYAYFHIYESERQIAWYAYHVQRLIPLKNQIGQTATAILYNDGTL